MHRFRSWPTQTTPQSHPHTLVQVQPRNTYNHTYIKIFAWTKQNNLLLNPDKTTCTLFTPDPAEYTSNLDLTLNNKALPMVTHPKGLGLTLDPKLTYSTHIHNISVQAHIPLQIIKALTATGWGKQMEILMSTYKTAMRRALEYASSIWLSLASSTNINKLQVMQNAALKTATGCTHTYNICMTKHSYFRYTSSYSYTRHNTNRKHNIHHIPYTNIQHTSTVQGLKTLCLTTTATQQIFLQIHTQSLQQPILYNTWIQNDYYLFLNYRTRTPVPHKEESYKILSINIYFI